MVYLCFAGAATESLSFSLAVADGLCFLFDWCGASYLFLHGEWATTVADGAGDDSGAVAFIVCRHFPASGSFSSFFSLESMARYYCEKLTTLDHGGGDVYFR